MLNWLHERDPIRYDVYCTLIKVAGKAGLMDQITVSLDQVNTCIGKCVLILLNISVKSSKKLLYIVIFMGATLYSRVYTYVTIKIYWLKSPVWPNSLILNYFVHVGKLVKSVFLIFLKYM